MRVFIEIDKISNSIPYLTIFECVYEQSTGRGIPNYIPVTFYRTIFSFKVCLAGLLKV